MLEPNRPLVKASHLTRASKLQQLCKHNQTQFRTVQRTSREPNRLVWAKLFDQGSCDMSLMSHSISQTWPQHHTCLKDLPPWTGCRASGGIWFGHVRCGARGRWRGDALRLYYNYTPIGHIMIHNASIDAGYICALYLWCRAFHDGSLLQPKSFSRAKLRMLALGPTPCHPHMPSKVGAMLAPTDLAWLTAARNLYEGEPSVVLICVTRYTAACCVLQHKRATRIFPADGRNSNTQGLPFLHPRDWLRRVSTFAPVLRATQREPYINPSRRTGRTAIYRLFWASHTKGQQFGTVGPVFQASSLPPPGTVHLCNCGLGSTGVPEVSATAVGTSTLHAYAWRASMHATRAEFSACFSGPCECCVLESWRAWSKSLQDPRMKKRRVVTSQPARMLVKMLASIHNPLRTKDARSWFGILTRFFGPSGHCLQQVFVVPSVNELQLRICCRQHVSSKGKVPQSAGMFQCAR